MWQLIQDGVLHGARAEARIKVVSHEIAPATVVNLINP